MHDPFYFRLFYPFLFPSVQSNLVQCTFTVLAFLITKLLSVYSSSQKSIIYTKGALSIVCTKIYHLYQRGIEYCVHGEFWRKLLHHSSYSNGWCL